MEKRILQRGLDLEKIKKGPILWSDFLSTYESLKIRRELLYL